ncbi:unnamed protein product [Rhodiola kirilowii]
MEKTEESNNEALIRSFSEITSATSEEAQFFLESHNWDLDSAVSTFFDNSAANAAVAAPAGAQPAIPPSPDSPRSSSPARSDSSQRSRSESPPRSPYRLRSRQDKQKLSMGSSSRSIDKGKKNGGKKAGGIRTLADLNRSGKDESDSDSDEPQEYYTGGGKSGMLVQDPTRGRDVDSIFDQARQAGVAPGQGDSTLPSLSSRSFTGTGRLLSGETVDTAPVQNQQPEPLTHTIYFWRNGFSVDDGPLRRMDDPQNAPFLESIMKSECPKELEPADRRIPVHVSLVRRGENYTEPEKPKLPFNGVGRTLGSSSSDVPVSQAVSSASTLNAAPVPSAGMTIDQNAPLTSIQIRLADGTRMVSRFNYHHTIGDLRAFINASRPGTSTTYQLQSMGFPPKQLLDSSQTIEQAGLANSVVIQRF